MSFFQRGGTFAESYSCYGLNKLQSKEKSESASYGGKIILPPSALARLASLHIEYPMLFKIEHEESSTNVGVLEFIAKEGQCYVPVWIMEQLSIEEGDIITLTNVTLPLGRFLKIQPQSTDFLDIHDPKAVLENALRQYSALTQNDIISIRYNNKVYRLLCMETKPNSEGISIVETDLEVDFAPPVGYEEPKRTRHTSFNQSSASLSIEEHKVDEGKKWSVFSGSGVRLNGKSMAAASPLDNISSGKPASFGGASDEVPVALRLPKNKLWFGYEVKPLQPASSK